MSRYIDADALKQQVESPYTEYPIMIQIRKALKVFIDDAPSLEQFRVRRKERAVSDDLIRRSDAIRVLQEVNFYSLAGAELTAIEAIKCCKAVEPKRGKWIDFKSGWKCNACEKWNSEKSNFCPTCGARMKGADDDSGNI